jgi:hypothetical protein
MLVVDEADYVKNPERVATPGHITALIDALADAGLPPGRCPRGTCDEPGHAGSAESRGRA